MSVGAKATRLALAAAPVAAALGGVALPLGAAIGAAVVLRDEEIANAVADVFGNLGSNIAANLAGSRVPDAWRDFAGRSNEDIARAAAQALHDALGDLQLDNDPFDVRIDAWRQRLSTALKGGDADVRALWARDGADDAIVLVTDREAWLASIETTLRRWEAEAGGTLGLLDSDRAPELEPELRERLHANLWDRIDDRFAEQLKKKADNPAWVAFQKAFLEEIHGQLGTIREDLRAIRQHLPVQPFPGFVPFERPRQLRHFRAYLSSDKLPFFSREKFRASRSGNPADLPSEADLLARLDDKAGLILTGGGGIGKSRLTLELGRLAHEAGSAVYRVEKGASEEALARLVDQREPGQPILLLFDYIETQDAFETLAQTVVGLGDDYGDELKLRFVANCRASYYVSVAGEDFAVGVLQGAQAGDDEEAYRHWVVSQILDSAGFPEREAHERVCSDQPVLAVFLRYLREQGRDEVLHALLDEKSFSHWVRRRLSASFPDQGATWRELAKLVAMFPLAERPPGPMGKLLDTLAADGWLVARDDGDGNEEAGRWLFAHDVFADQLLLDYLCQVERTAAEFAEETFAEAVSQGALGSALVAFQRLAATPEVRAIDWRRVFQREFAARAEAWLPLRVEVFKSPLLGHADRMALLRAAPDLWAGVEREFEFHLAAGHIAREWTHAEPGPSAEDRATLGDWLAAAAATLPRNNYVVTSALRWQPEAAREAALAWIEAFPLEIQTHYLLYAWLQAGLEREPIRKRLAAWCGLFTRTRKWTFAAAAWWRRLKADGLTGKDLDRERDLLARPMSEWLAGGAGFPEASHVYNAWLDAAGDRSLVEDPIRQWLALHASAPEASHVNKAWLNATQDRSLVEDPIRQWLVKHRTTPEARYVYKAWLDAAGDRSLVEDPIRQWLALHASAPEASHVYNAWLDATQDRSLVEKFIPLWLAEHAASPEASHVYKAWLDAGGDPQVVREGAAAWLATFPLDPVADYVYRAWLRAKLPFAEIREPALAWLHANRDRRDATFLLKEVTLQPDLPPETVADVLYWCEQFADDEDALWRLSRLRHNIFAPGREVPLLRAAEAIFRTRIAQARLDPTAIKQLDLLAVQCGVHRSLAEPPPRHRTDALLSAWLNDPRSFGAPSFSNWPYRRDFVRRVAELAAAGQIGAVALTRYLGWTDRWDEANRQAAAEEIAALRRLLEEGG